jgi:hypothetical protein
MRTLRKSPSQGKEKSKRILILRRAEGPSRRMRRTVADMPDRTCGEAAIALIEAYGVDTVFGIPGVHTLELYKGLAKISAR